MEGEGVPTPSIAAAPPSSPADHPDLSLVGSPEGNDRYFDQFLQSSHENDLPQSDTVALNDDLRARISIATAPPSSPPDHPDFSPVGSPEGNDRYFDQFLQSSHENDMPQSDTVSLNDDLRARIIKQAEYYFSDENLATDKFLMNYITKNRERFVPIGVIASFRKMKKLSKDASIIVAALKESSLLVVSSDGKKVKRANPLPITEVKDPQLCTVLVENLPEDHSVDNIRQIFGKAGDIKNISIRDAHAAKESRKCTVAEKLLSGKLHALVEYETVESAEKAVATLNDEQDWRYGMRVKLLKRAGKHGQRNKGWEFDSEKNSSVQPSDPADEGEKPPPNEHQDDMPDEEDGEHLSKEKNGNRNRNRGRGRRQKHHANNGQVVGHVTTVSSGHGVEISKPPPGPRMPDGTRGFAMGRGKPPASSNQR